MTLNYKLMKPTWPNILGLNSYNVTASDHAAVVQVGKHVAVVECQPCLVWEVVFDPPEQGKVARYSPIDLHDVC